MSAPFIVEDVAFGPDVSSTPAEPPADHAEPSQTMRASRGVPESAKTPTGRLRALTDHDRERLAKVYCRIGKMCEYIKPALADALIDNADDCARAWCDLARKNQKVRAKILQILEGGDWVQLGLAHSPIFLALLPEAFLEKILLRVTASVDNLFASAETPEDIPEQEQER